MTTVLHIVAAFLLALLGYSSGATMISGAGDPRPGTWEVPVAAAVAIMGPFAAVYVVGGWVGLVAAIAVGLSTGLVARAVWRFAGPRRKLPDGGSPEPAPESETAFGHLAEASDDGVVRTFLLRLGAFQGHLTMALLYFSLLAPFSAVSRLAADPFRLEEKRSSYWREPPSSDVDEVRDSLRRQY